MCKAFINLHFTEEFETNILKFSQKVTIVVSDIYGDSCYCIRALCLLYFSNLELQMQ
jgi:hypothetical protein